MRVNVTLACTECGDRNYITTKKISRKELSKKIDATYRSFF